MYLFVDGALLKENTSVDINWDGDDQDVQTTAKGWAGISPSPVSLSINVENVIPPAGFEFDAAKAFVEKTEHEIKCMSGATGKSLVSKGYVRQPKLASGVGKVTQYTWGFKGTPATWS